MASKSSSAPRYREGHPLHPILLWSLFTFWLFFQVQPVLGVIHTLPSWHAIIVLGLVAIFCGLFLYISWQRAHALLRDTIDVVFIYRVWGILIAITLFLTVFDGPQWLALNLYICASVGSVSKARQAVYIIGGLFFMAIVLSSLKAVPIGFVLQGLFLMPVIGITTGSLRHALKTNQELRMAREEIARLAVTEERLRFARDLHDLLGHSLSLITIKSELAGYLIDESPQQAKQEVREIEAAARTALQEVREAVLGYRQSTVATELEGAQELLRAVGIAMRIDGVYDALPPPVAVLFGWAVREAVTNVLRHSQARRCNITFQTDDAAYRLIIADDGRGLTSEGQTGSGLRGLTERAAALDGWVDRRVSDMGGFEIAVIVPCTLSLQTPHIIVPREEAHA